MSAADAPEPTGKGAGSGAEMDAVAAAAVDFEPLLPGLILLLPLLGFALNGALALASGRRAADATRSGGEWELPERKADRPATHRWPTWIGPAVVGLAFVITAINFVRMLGVESPAPVIRSYWTWMVTGNLELEAAIQLDPLSMIMMMVVTGVGFLIHVFSVGYMKDDPGYPRFFAYLNLFVFFMLVLVAGASFPVMFVGWEGVGLCSYLLIGFWFRDKLNADAGKKAFIVNRVGDFGFLVAMFLLFAAVGTLDYVGAFEAAPTELAYGGGVVTAITLFLLLGAVGKSAQIPLHVWLPDAMAGPTPVSALIHAATMVTAGVYMVARSSVLFTLSPTGTAVVAGIGALTAIFAATIALAQTDIKRVLAYSTISQLGFMFAAVGVGAYAVGVFHLMTHAFFKALLFLGAGAVIHAMHEAYHATHRHDDAQDMRNMGGLRRFMPVTWITMWVGTLAIAGIWPFAGFFSKDEVIWAAGTAAVGPFETTFVLFWALLLLAAVLTAIYMTRLMILTFHGSSRVGDAEAKHLHESPKVMTVPLVALAVLSVVGGWVNVPGSIRESFFGGFGLLPMTDWLDRWMEPVTGAAHSIRLEHVGEMAASSPVGGGHVLWAGIAFVIALVAVLGTVAALRDRDVKPAAEEGEPAQGIHGFLYSAWRVDELYDRVIVQPVLKVSRAAWRFIDAAIIDGLVNAAGAVVRGVGWIVSLFQTGQVNTYAFILAVGVLWILGVLIL